MTPEQNSIDVLKLSRGIAARLRNAGIETVGDLLDHATGIKLRPLQALPGIGEKAHIESVMKAVTWISVQRWRNNIGEGNQA